MTSRTSTHDPRWVATAAYIAVVATLAVVLAVVAFVRDGVPDLAALAVFLVLSVLHVVLPEAAVEGRVRVSLSSVLLLAGLALLGPAGASVVGALLGLSQGRRLPARYRAFNSAQFSLHATVGGLAFLWAGGTAEASRLTDAGGILLGLAVPLLVADITQAAVNLVTLAGVLRVAQGVPMRHQILLILRGTGLAYVGYGVIAFIMVILWSPAGLGPMAAVIVLAPLVVAQWAYRQHAEELRGQERALEVLVSALEAKAPRLAGHSARVAELSERMAEHLGLGPQQVADTRMAGMLHDIGQTSLPTRLVRGLDLLDPEGCREYARSGATLLGDLTILRGALEPIRRHRDDGDVDGEGAASLPARIVGLADAYDLLTQVGSPDGPLHAPSQARDLLAARVVDDPALVRALDHALARGAEVGRAT
ncbi:HD domain-containing protein [Phycicoccus endophyticus]|uniref:HD domain-containing protein n=1 Tax=Phycicoccus endophyticus TaxID=1690220 RepID=A0A7G9QYQ9_9MICO|nr:HD domain-containing phosphohydrolase [Phycicoccus endophyticus]NHI20479.1 HD domain-containing protein [Phycicoccus endophyticus]QNN48484.1 HD domain-containing protein [Phycicoccus endophyticus]GGL30475.1 hypothetical protein GCM10012283_10990 [Phycicoccus endophyticus]